MRKSFTLALMVAGSLTAVGASGAYAVDKHHAHKGVHVARPEHHVHLMSQHVPITISSQGSRTDAFLRQSGKQTEISALARGLKSGQTLTLQSDTIPRCGTGTIQTVGTLSTSANKMHGFVSTPRHDIRSLLLKTSGGQIAGCGTVRRHKSA